MSTQDSVDSQKMLRRLPMHLKLPIDALDGVEVVLPSTAHLSEPTRWLRLASRGQRRGIVAARIVHLLTYSENARVKKWKNCRRRYLCGTKK